MNDLSMVPRRLDDLSRLTHAAFSRGFTSPHETDILVVRFCGEYGYGCQGNGDARFMCAMLSAYLDGWSPYVLILDLRDLKYEWGDMIENVLAVPARQPIRHFEHAVRVMAAEANGEESDPFHSIPTAILVSEKCCAGLTSLLISPTGSLSQLLFDDLDVAVVQLVSRYKSMYP